MRSDSWRKVQLGEILTLRYGKSLVSHQRNSGIIPVYSSSGITGWHDIPLVNDKGIIVGRKGNVGSVYYSDTPFYCIDTAYYVTPDDTEVDFLFLYYLLQTLGLNALNEDSAVPGLNRKTALSQWVSIPIEKQIQSLIANQIAVYDDKIQLNHQTNATLEAIAQAIFKEWFVDFNYPGATGEMVESELGPIPKGWNITHLGDEGEFKNGVNYSRGESGDHTYSIVNVRNIVGNRYVLKAELDNIAFDARKAAQYKLSTQDIIIARSASPGEAAILFEPSDETIFSGFTIRYRIHTREHVFFFFLLIQSIKEKLADLANGTTLKSINQASLKSVQMVLPDEKTLGDFSTIVSPIYENIFRNQLEARLLCKTRDLLLPHLMNNSLDLG